MSERKIETSIFPHNKACGDEDLINAQLVIHLLEQIDVLHYKENNMNKIKEIKIVIIEDEENAKKPFAKEK